ncbi:MAG: glycosyltransferase family 2 protein [Nitrospirae bacterium]|nr:glycosyltransferase family 2 protein [Nitrospirota bacterium]
MVLIVLPAYNEAQNIAALLVDFKAAFEEEPIAYRIIVVNDGSTDDTAATVRAHADGMPIRLIEHAENRGLAEALRTGLVEAVAQSGPQDIIMTMDADHSHPPGLFFRMLRMIREGNDIVIASRYRPGARVKGLSLMRRILSRVASWLFRIFHPIEGVKDYTCGYRAYRSDLLRRAFNEHGKAFISESGFSCMVDILLKLKPYRPIINEVPLILRYDMKSGTSKMKIAKTISETLGLMVRRIFTLKG